MSSTQGHSNVGFRGVYESQNQRHYTQEEMDEMAKHTGENVRGFMPSMLLPTLVPDPESHPEQLTQSQQRARRRNSTGSRQKRSVSRPPTFPFHPLRLARIITNCCFCLQIHRKQAESLKKDPTLAVSPSPPQPHTFDSRTWR